MAFGKADLPLARDASGRFLPWLVAFMVYLATLALVSSMIMNALVDRWDRGLADRLTVQIPAPSAEDEAGGQEARIDAAIDVLTSTPGVGGVAVLDDSEISALLDPWLGDAELARELPLPTLIAVTLSADDPADLGTLAVRLQAAVPGAVIDDHQRWVGGLVSLTRSIDLIAALVVLLVGLAAVITVVFVTRTGLAIHRQVIELLHLIGAQDSYIARQFQTHAMKLGFKGGALGFAAALATVYGAGLLLSESGRVLLPDFSFGPREWIGLCLLPLLATLVAMVTARWTVLRTLARFP
ncbi:MAG: FtsX-like permease family protein [Rhodovibrionaceae bacterium]